MKARPARGTPSRAKRTSPPSSPNPKEFFEFVSSHFILIAALVVVVGVTAATTGLGAYLRVFDWRLIWLVEYADVLKWGVIVGALVLSAFLALTAWTIVDDAIVWVTSDNYRGAIAAFVLWCASLGLWFLTDFLSEDPHYALTFWVHMAILLCATSILNIALTVKSFPSPRMRWIFSDVFFVIFAAAAVGSAIGYYVRDSEGFGHHVSLSDGREFRGVGFVMMTDRYIVLWDRDHALVLPTSEITGIEGHPKPGS